MEASKEPVVLCALCGQGIDEAADVACGLCAAAHHRDCFEYTGICSAYGCGGIATVAYSRSLVPLELIIDESTRSPVALGSRLGGLTRGLVRRRSDLLRTLAAGVGGGVLATVGMLAWMVHYFGLAAIRFGGPLGQLVLAYAGGIMLCGVLHGLVSPFVAPLQHRYPVRTVIIAGSISLGAWLAGGWFSAPLFIITVISGIVTTWAAAEWMVGDYSPVGRRLGRLAAPVRFLVAAGIFLLSSVLACSVVGFPIVSWLLADIGLWTILAVVAGGPSVEVGKEEYRKHLIALVEARPS